MAEEVGSEMAIVAAQVFPSTHLLNLNKRFL